MSRKRGQKIKLYKATAIRTGLVCGICKESLLTEWQEYMDRHNKVIKKKRTHIDLTLDHIYPKKFLKGTTMYWDVENLQLAHKKCNNLKADNISAEYGNYNTRTKSN